MSFSLKAQSNNLERITSKNILDVFLITDISLKKDTDYQTKSTISQIGNANTIEVYNKSEKSNITLNQTGNYNTTLLVNAETRSNPQTKINVNGSNNHVDITGSNSISDKLIINLKSDDKMIFMRNYK